MRSRGSCQASPPPHVFGNRHATRDKEPCDIKAALPLPRETENWEVMGGLYTPNRFHSQSVMIITKRDKCAGDKFTLKHPLRRTEREDDS